LLDFSRSDPTLETTRRSSCFTSRRNLSRYEIVQGWAACQEEERTLSLGQKGIIKQVFCCQFPKVPLRSIRILTHFPFEGRFLSVDWVIIRTKLSRLLGPAYPCPKTVDMEPFPTSVFNEFQLNNCYYNQDLYPWNLQRSSRMAFFGTKAPPYSLSHRVLLLGLTENHKQHALASSIFGAAPFGR